MNDEEETDITRYEGLIRTIGKVEYDLTNPEDSNIVVVCDYRDGRLKDDGTPAGFEFAISNTPIPLLERWFAVNPRVGDALDVYIATESTVILRVDYPDHTMEALLSRLEELERVVAGADGVLR